MLMLNEKWFVVFTAPINDILSQSKNIYNIMGKYSITGSHGNGLHVAE